MWKKKIGYVYMIAALRGLRMTWTAACLIAENHSEAELCRRYMTMKGRNL